MKQRMLGVRRSCPFSIMAMLGVQQTSPEMANKPLLEDSVLIAQRVRKVNMIDNISINIKSQT
jgi:hypothetical protein